MKRFIKGMLLYAAFFFASAFVQAWAVGPSATLTWVAPTLNTDGTPITLPITYNVYQGASGAEASVQTGVSGLTVTLTAGLADGATVCWQLTTVAGGVESARTNELCQTFPKATPNPPTIVTVTISP